MKTLLDETLALLDESTDSISDLAESAGVNRHWLEKFKQRRYKNPRIRFVQQLHDYLSQQDSHTAA